jgi:PilZ domain-containing protein
MSDPPEPRFVADLAVRVFGMDAVGRPFSRNAHTLDISDRGARLSGLEAKLLVGDVIGVQLGDSKARCRVIWVTGSALPIDAGVEIVSGQPCPWERQRAAHRTMASSPILRTAPVVKDKRKFRRHRISFPLEIRHGQSVGSVGAATTADMSAGGCYVETRTPLPVTEKVTIAFWLNSERVQTTGVVRTSDRGVGMGIEFTGLDEAAQEQLQRQVESMDSPLMKAQGAS